MSVEHLAIDGGPPAFVEPRHVGAPNVAGRDRFLARVETMLDRNRLTNNGPFVRQFEQVVAERCGVEHCVAVGNATSGLQVAARLLELEGEVIVPAWTFVATAHALQWLGITPVFADVDPLTQTICADAVADAITPRTTGVVGVHLFSQICDDDALRRVTADAGVSLMYDAAHAFGASRNGTRAGAFGELEVFSFHATKFLNTFEGGALVTNDTDLAERARLAINFGFSGRDNVVSLGVNAKMPEVNAAMGLTQLEFMDQTIEANRARHERYAERLGAVPGVELVHSPEPADPVDDADIAWRSQQSNHQYVVLRVDRAAAGVSRDELLGALEAENVLARRYFHPGVHQMEPYRSLQPDAGLALPVTETLSQTVLVLPTGTAMSMGDVETVADLIAAIVERRSSAEPALPAAVGASGT